MEIGSLGVHPQACFGHPFYIVDRHRWEEEDWPPTGGGGLGLFLVGLILDLRVAEQSFKDGLVQNGYLKGLEGFGLAIKVSFESFRAGDAEEEGGRPGLEAEATSGHIFEHTPFEAKSRPLEGLKDLGQAGAVPFDYPVQREDEESRVLGSYEVSKDIVRPSFSPEP